MSPFKLGPCELYDGHVARNMENGWQYSKVYDQHIIKSKTRIDDIFPTQAVSSSYLEWAKEGWANPQAVRYPMGKGAKPRFSLWEDRRLRYIDARKVIYGPLYARAVVQTNGFVNLQNLYHTSKTLILLDYDAYDHHRFNMTLTDVLNEPARRMGHAFVLAMLLTKDVALKQMELPEDVEY